MRQVHKSAAQQRASKLIRSAICDQAVRVNGSWGGKALQEAERAHAVRDGVTHHDCYTECYSTARITLHRLFVHASQDTQEHHVLSLLHPPASSITDTELGSDPEPLLLHPIPSPCTHPSAGVPVHHEQSGGPPQHCAGPAHTERSHLQVHAYACRRSTCWG